MSVPVFTWISGQLTSLAFSFQLRIVYGMLPAQRWLRMNNKNIVTPCRTCEL